MNDLGEGTRLAHLANVLTVIAATVALIVGGIVLVPRLSSLTTSEESDASPRPLEIADWQWLAADGHRLGSADASVTIVEFADYQGPASRAWWHQLEAVLRRYEDDVAYVYRHWPLRYHPSAYAAARAAECASDQGRFWEFHRLLYTTDDWFGDMIVRMAAEAGVVDEDRFVRCLAAFDPVPMIERGIAAAIEIGAGGTPTVLVNGEELRPRDSTALVAAIERILGGVPDG